MFISAWLLWLLSDCKGINHQLLSALELTHRLNVDHCEIGAVTHIFLFLRNLPTLIAMPAPDNLFLFITLVHCVDSKEFQITLSTYLCQLVLKSKH